MSGRPFIYCLNTSTIRPTPLLEKIKVAGEAGYEAIEPWNDEVDAYLAQGGSLSELRSALSDAGLRVVGMIALHGWISSEGLAHARCLEDCRRRMDQAAYLGSPYIVASPPQEVIDISRAATRFAELSGMGKIAGVEPSIEFLGFVDGIKSVETALAIAEGSQVPGATVVADVFHMIRGGGGVDDLLKLRGDQLACFHVNDVPKFPDPLTQTDAYRVLPGEGIADLPRVFGNLRAIGYRGPISLELFNPTLWAKDPRDVVKLGLERIKGLVEG